MLYTDEFKMALEESIDGPHGYVIAKDKKTGKILINKHNMIVKTGKEYLWSLFLKQQGAPADAYSSDLAATEYTLRRAVFSDKTLEVNYNDSIPTEPGLTGISFTLAYDNTNTNSTSAATFSEYNGHRFLSFTFSITGSLIKEDGLKSISSLELQTASATSAYSLFSRIRFDTIPLTKDSDIEIVYYIYF